MTSGFIAPAESESAPPRAASRSTVGRYQTLDALRGVAAIAVVIFHLHAFNLLPNFLPHAYLAVDFFFVLSGFVIAHAYGEALLHRMSWRDFARRRIIRLAPLAVLGSLLGFLALVLKWELFPYREDSLINIVLSGVLNLFMLPSFFTGKVYDYAMFPGNGPLWSLFFELVVNFIWAFVGPRLTLRATIIVVIAAAGALVAISVAHGSTRMGVEPATFLGGAARATFGFMMGVLLYRLRDRYPSPSSKWSFLVSAVLLLIAFRAPVAIGGKTIALIWDLIWIVGILPFIVALGASREGNGAFSERLGELSYPIYVLHWPCLAILSGVRQKVFSAVDPVAFSALALTAMVIISWSTFKLYDEPLRSRLSRLGR